MKLSKNIYGIFRNMNIIFDFDINIMTIVNINTYLNFY